jgi:hypothetical protein
MKLWPVALIGGVTGFAMGFVNAAIGVPFWLAMVSAFVNGMACAAGATKVSPQE